MSTEKKHKDNQSLNRRYKEAVDHLKATDYPVYRVIASRVESYKTIADTWRARCLKAEAALEAHQENK